MKIPKKVKIGGFIWSVNYNKDLSYESGNHASTHFKPQKIFIDPEGTQQNKEECLIHEILHAVFWQTGLWERYREQKNLEEEIVTTLAHGLYQVFKDNKLIK